MARKKDVVKKIDQKSTSVGAPLPLMQEDQPTPPAFATIPAPDTLVELGQAIQRSTQAPLVQVALGWQEAPNISPDYYNVDYSESSDFSNAQRRRAYSTSATIDGLKANGITYYFRVQAVVSGIYSDFSETLAVVTMADTTPPPDVTDAAAAFEYSDLVITYEIPTSEILKDVKIDIYNAAHTIHYGTFYTRSERFVWTAEQNIFATGGVPLTSVDIDIHTRSWTNEPSVTGVFLTATAPIPDTPTGYSSNWIGDAGLASADFVTAWLASANADSYDVTVDGIAYSTRDTRFVYRYDKNVADHTPTLASGDPSFVWLLAARDKLGQVSVPVNVTVTNAAPPNGVMSMSVSPGFTTLGATVGLTSSTIVQDFDHFEWQVWNGSTYVRTINTPDPSVIFDLAAFGSGTYTPSVTMVDKFNQRSTTLSGAPQVLDVLTIEQLRAETQYTDSLGTSAAILARLKDGVLYDGSGAYQFYGASAGWKWLQADRPLLDRYKQITFSAFWDSDLGIYFAVDTPTGTVYYSGPFTGNVNDPLNVFAMTRYTVQATAQTNAYFFGSASNGTKRFDFTRIEESRNVRMYFTNPTNTFGLYEFYPRRLVQSDDIEAESIRSINIAALGINADRIFATNLRAFTAQMGSLHIDELLDIATNGIIFQGTGTGTLLQNAVTPTSFNVTGLKIYQVSGVGKLSTYNTGVEQITLDTDGRLKAGAGNTVLDSAGMYLLVNNFWSRVGGGIASSRSINFKSAYGNGDIGIISAADYNSGAYNYFDIMAASTATRYGRLHLGANTTNSFTDAFIELNGGANIANTSIQMWSTNIDIVGFSTNRPTISIGDSLAGTNADIHIYGATTNSGTLQVSGTLTASGNIYWGTGGGLLSAYLNQPVLTGSSVQFANINAFDTITANGTGGGYVHLNNYGGATKRSALRYYQGATALWEIGSDYDATNTQSLYIYDHAAAAHRLVIGASGGLQLAYRMYIGAVGVAPTHQITLSTDSAGKPTTNVWSVTSDERTKKDVKPFDHGLADLRAFPMPVSYKYNGVNGTPTDDKEGIGYIAQHVLPVAPKMVEKDQNGFLHINTGAMQPMFHKSIIEIDDRVILLEQRIKELEEQLKNN
jgi:hypothetical protein